MRGEDDRSGSLFSCVDLEARVPAGHPLRRIRELVNDAPAELEAVFLRPVCAGGGASIAPEKPLRASLLQMLYSIRSERRLMERPEFDLLFRRFVGLGIDDTVRDASTVSKNRDRLPTTEMARGFPCALLAAPRVMGLPSNDHFSVDGTLLKARASMKSFRPKDGGGNPPGAGRNGERDFRGEKRSNRTHASTRDPDARLYRKGNGRESRPCYMGHALMDNRNGPAVGGEVSHATGTAEREVALGLVDRHRPGKRRITLGGDKGYDVSGFVNDLRARRVTPHVAVDGHVRVSGTPRKSAIDKRTTRHPGHAISQVIRKRIEESFGRTKTTGGLAQVKLRGPAKVRALFLFALAAHNPVRIPKLLAAPG